MKTFHFVLIAALLISAALAGHASGQGPLSPPPGAPAPTMKSLDQVEARSVINAANTPGDGLTNQFIISQSGSYYLTGNITGVSGKTAISVTASNVTIDLNGFSLTGVPGSVYGIRAPVSISNLEIHNGVVRDWGNEGLSAFNAINSRFRNVRSYGNSAWGLVIGAGSGIDSCQAFTNGTGSPGTGGIYARFGSSITNCVAEGNTAHGIYTEDGCTISGCTAGDTALSAGANGHGISTGIGCNVSGSSARSNAGTGIVVTYEGIITSCVATNNAVGIDAGFYSSVSNCTAAGNKSTGISAGFGCMVNSCSASVNGSGAPTDAGIKLGVASTLTLSLVVQNNPVGINASPNCLISKSSSFNNNGPGILVGGTCTVQECLVAGNSGAGISLTGDSNRIEGNNAARNSPDILMSGSSSTSGQSVVIRNSVSARFTAVAGDDVAPQAPAATATSPWANLAQP